MPEQFELQVWALSAVAVSAMLLPVAAVLQVVATVVECAGIDSVAGAELAVLLPRFEAEIA